MFKPKFFQRNTEEKTHRQIEEEKERIRKYKIVGRLLFILWVILGSLAIIKVIIDFFNHYEFQSPFVEKEIISTYISSEDTITETTTLYEGKVSYYSHDGCLGCHPQQLMGNGQQFDENKMTLAVRCEDVLAGKISYDTNVRVTNLDNGKSIQAIITDCGGFSHYGRIADLSKGLAMYLGAQTDTSNVRIELL